MYRFWNLLEDKFEIIPEDYWTTITDVEPLLFNTREEAEQYLDEASNRILERDPDTKYRRSFYEIREV